eukprot:4631790-Pyramimonas_sp.AAC.1
MTCAQWYTSVDGRRLSTVELKSKAFWPRPPPGLAPALSPARINTDVSKGAAQTNRARAGGIFP